MEHFQRHNNHINRYVMQSAEAAIKPSNTLMFVLGRKLLQSPMRIVSCKSANA